MGNGVHLAGDAQGVEFAYKIFAAGVEPGLSGVEKEKRRCSGMDMGERGCLDPEFLLFSGIASEPEGSG